MSGSTRQTLVAPQCLKVSVFRSRTPSRYASSSGWASLTGRSSIPAAGQSDHGAVETIATQQSCTVVDVDVGGGQAGVGFASEVQNPRSAVDPRERRFSAARERFEERLRPEVLM